MSDRVAYDTWVQANQRCLVGEFDRLKARLTGGESAETAGHNIDEIDAEGPAQESIFCGTAWTAAFYAPARQ